MTAGQRIHEIAKEKRISQKELAEAIGVSQSSVSEWKKGSAPSGDNLIKAAQFLGVSVERLSGEAPIHNVVTGNIHSNNGIIGNTHAPVTINNGTSRHLSDQEIELLHIFGDLKVMDRAKLLVYANELKEKK